MIYQSQNKLPLAEKYVKEALAIADKLTDHSLRLSILHSLANIYGMQGKIDEAFKLDAEGIDLAGRTNNEFAKALVLRQHGKLLPVWDSTRL